MIVQLIAPGLCKYVKLFGLSRAHKVPPVFGMDAHTDMNPMSPVRGIRPAGDKYVVFAELNVIKTVSYIYVPVGHYVSVHHTLRVPLGKQHPAIAKPFQQIIIHCNANNHDVDVI